MESGFSGCSLVFVQSFISIYLRLDHTGSEGIGNCAYCKWSSSPCRRLLYHQLGPNEAIELRLSPGGKCFPVKA
jgi:hypothetical protein